MHEAGWTIQPGELTMTTIVADAERERKRIEGEFRRALHVLGMRRSMELCREHADACYMEAANGESRTRWRSVWSRIDRMIAFMQP
jgi:hypothetical protein